MPNMRQFRESLCRSYRRTSQRRENTSINTQTVNGSDDSSRDASSTVQSHKKHHASFADKVRLRRNAGNLSAASSELAQVWFSVARDFHAARGMMQSATIESEIR